ncbi:hypothetical protein ACFLR9_10845 [Bacteroidota bacterium]
METDTIRLLFDAGLVVLIWMIQLIVYPGFLYYEKDDLMKWHKYYTSRLSLIVIPLMFGQLILAVIQLVQFQAIETIVSLTLVIAVWASTFLQFVPIHNQIFKNNSNITLLKQLVKRNWLRTILWTLIFCWSIYNKL